MGKVQEDEDTNNVLETEVMSFIGGKNLQENEDSKTFSNCFGLVDQSSIEIVLDHMDTELMKVKSQLKCLHLFVAIIVFDMLSFTFDMLYIILTFYHFYLICYHLY